VSWHLIMKMGQAQVKETGERGFDIQNDTADTHYLQLRRFIVAVVFNAISNALI